MRKFNLITLTLLFVSILLTSCEKGEENIEPEATTVEYNYDLGVISPNVASGIQVQIEEASTSYTLSLSSFFSEYSAIKGKISSIELEYENIHSINHSSIGYSDIDLYILCDYKTYQQNENSFLITILDSDNVSHKITVTFKLLYEETFKLAKALINNSRDNSLKLTSSSGAIFTGVDFFDFEMDLINTLDYGKNSLDFKFLANQRGGSLAGRSWLGSTENKNYDYIYIYIAALPVERFNIYQYGDAPGGGVATSNSSYKNFTVNGNTVTVTEGTYSYTFTLN
jgi:hypothetical protein